jgi:hypothetical protein
MPASRVDAKLYRSDCNGPSSGHSGTCAGRTLGLPEVQEGKVEAPRRPGAICTAVQIRLVDLDHVSGFVIGRTPRGRKWFAHAPSVPRHWFPRYDLDPKSFAFGAQFGGRSDDSAPWKVGADALVRSSGRRTVHGSRSSRPVPHRISGGVGRSERALKLDR